MTNLRTSVAVLAALFPLGCYVGVEPKPHPIGQAGDEGDPPSPPPAPEDDDDTEPPDEEPEPAEDPFEVPAHEVRLLPFGVRLNNLARLVGVEQNDAMFTELLLRRTMLGDHDYANGVAPDLSWGPTKMSAWVKGLKPVCSSASWQERYPNVSTDPTPLLRNVLAREPESDELEAYQALAENAGTTTRADELTCLAALSSLDFVAR